MSRPTSGLPPVHQYIWRDYSLPRFKSVVLTIGLKEGIYCFAFLAVAFTFTQTRSWAILKVLGFRLLRPHRVGDDPDDPDSIERLTQAKTLKALLGRHKFQSDPSMATPAKLLGLVAIVNALAFFTIGVFAPLYLTGDLGTAVVRSKFTDHCVGFEDRDQSKRYTAQLADSFFKRCLLNTSDVSPACSEESGIVGSIPPLLVSRESSCPFPGDACVGGIQPVRVEYKGLSARDFGVNLDRRILIDHRLTCVPLKTEQFMLSLGPDHHVIWFGRSFHDPSYQSNVSAAWGTFLKTVNGPNSHSKAFSGHPGAITGQPQSVYEFNIYPFGPPSVDSGEEYHPSLRRDDGHVFITMLRAGRSLYQVPIDDPFYAAHISSAGMYIPDYEATALGCVEQFRMCFNDTRKSFCTKMGRTNEASMEMVVWGVHEKVLSKDLGSLGFDLLFVYDAFLMGLASLRQYFYTRTGTQVLLTSLFRKGDIVDYVDQKEQWVEEVKAWFETAFLNGRYSLLQVVRRDGAERQANATASMVRLCRLILFQSNDHTNVDFIGLMAVLSALLLICAVSFGKQIRAASVSLGKLYIKGGKYLASIFCNLCVRPLIYLWYQLKGALTKLRVRWQSRPRFPHSRFWHGHEDIDLSNRGTAGP